MADMSAGTGPCHHVVFVLSSATKVRIIIVLSKYLRRKVEECFVIAERGCRCSREKPRQKQGDYTAETGSLCRCS